MKETSLVHIIADGCVLMMHRISKKNDINHGKWIGVGGKFEWGETPEECMRREVREETGLWVDQYRYCGIVTFVSDDDDMEYMHLFTVTAFHDRNQASGKDVRLRECDEGTLEWIPKEMLSRIPHWAGDRIFLPLILDMEIPFFSMKLVYQKGALIHASMNEHNCFVTQRLVLRPWLAEDVPCGAVLLRQRVKHVLTHRILYADFWLWEVEERPQLPDDYFWIKEEEVGNYGVPRLIEILLETLNT